MNDSEIKAMAQRLATKWCGNKPPEKHEPDARALGPGESSSQDLPEPSAGLKDPKENDGHDGQ
jgi:hypothetical protein